jgi:C4-dicarboxylate transporter DctM subunit
MALLASMFTVLLLLAVPIGIVLAGSSLVFILFDPMISPGTVFRSFFNFLSKYTLMAIPFFIFAGFLMERTGLVAKLFRFSDAVIGWVPGGYGFATLLASVIFGAISGSSTAMAAAMGVIAYPEMRKRGYPPWLAAGVIASGGGIAILIPPSILLILFGVLTETSIVDLFFAGVVPGLLLALSDAIVLVFFAWYLKLPSGRFDLDFMVSATREAWPALLMPVILLGGLYGGFFTPTEAGAAACGYALVYGLLIKRREFLKDLLPVTLRSLNLTSVIFLLLGCVGVFQFVLANKGWAQHLLQWATALDLTAFGFLLVLLPAFFWFCCRHCCSSRCS